MDAPQSAPTRMAYDHRDTLTTLAVFAASMSCSVGGLFGLLMGWWSWPVATPACVVAFAGPVWILWSSLPGYAADMAGLEAVAAAAERARHDAVHGLAPRRVGWVRSRAARLRCPTGHGHCVHPAGDEAMTDVVFTDTGVEHVDRGGWCCGCPARWRFTPVPVPACRVCQGTCQ